MTKKYSFKDVHKDIKNYISSSEDDCFKVGTISRDLGRDPRTIKRHLEIFEIDSIGEFTNESETIFCVFSKKSK